ncbi:MAG: hypothetical protein ACR2IP_10245 [Solirubrobacteraceae bacterium]
MTPSEPGQEPTEEELRAAYEAELKKIRVEHVLLEHVVSLVNLGMLRTGLSPGTESERDPGQVRLAIEAIRVVLPLLEQAAPQQIKPIRDALSQLQLAFVKIGGQPLGSAPAGAPDSGVGAAPDKPGPAPGAPSPPKQDEPGPARASGRLWIPGQ